MKAEWRVVTLDQIATNLDSQRVPITKAAREKGEYPYYGASGVVDHVADYIFEGDALLVSEDGANLLARSSPIAFPATGKYWVNNHAHILRFEAMETQRFVELYLESVSIRQYVTGAAQPKLTQRALNSIPIPLPNLPEQRRIVAILDKAFASITIARANAEKNLQNARALFESQLDSVFSGGQEAWIESPVAQCFRVKSGDFLPAKSMVVSGSFDVYGGNGVAGKHDEKNLSGENIVIGRVGAKCGNVRLVRGDIWLTDNAFFISEYLRPLDLEFLARLLDWKKLRQTANQAAQPVISYSTIREVMLRFPTTQREQAACAKKLRDVEEEIHRLESIYRRKLAALDELKQSLLHQAFSGQL